LFEILDSFVNINKVIGCLEKGPRTLNDVLLVKVLLDILVQTPKTIGKSMDFIALVSLTKCESPNEGVHPRAYPTGGEDTDVHL